MTEPLDRDPRPEGSNQTSKFDIHLDLKADQLEELRTGKKILVLADRHTGDQVRVGSGPLNQPVTWKSASAFLAVMTAICANIYVVAVRTAEIKLAIQRIDPLAKEMVTAMAVLAQHGEEFANLRGDLTTVLDLYGRLDAKVERSGEHPYTELDAKKDSATHAEFHRLEKEAWDAKLTELRLRLSQHDITP